nr:MAG TPA: hypothetical protein [Caudoviricetes sp.]
MRKANDPIQGHSTIRKLCDAILFIFKSKA